jgi:hypothetical protein
MEKSKLRLYFNIFAGVIFISYLGLLIFTDIPNVKWSIGFILLMTMVYIIRDKVAPKQKRRDKHGND